MILKKIKKLCLEQGMTINRIEVICGFSHGSIQKWSKHPPSVYKVKQVCDLLGITVDELLREE